MWNIQVREFSKRYLNKKSEVREPHVHLGERVKWDLTNLTLGHWHLGSSVWKADIAQLCLTLCDPMDCSPPGFSVHGILQARILEWVAIPFSGDLPNPGIKPGSVALQADSLSSEPPANPYLISYTAILLPSIAPDKLTGLPPLGMSKARFELYCPCTQNLDPARYMVNRYLLNKQMILPLTSFWITMPVESCSFELPWYDSEGSANIL